MIGSFVLFLSKRIIGIGLLLLAAVNGSAAQSEILIPITNTWRYEQTANLDGVNWQHPTFNDSGWPSGIGLLYVESNPAVTPRNTLLTLGRITYYFRTHFQYTNSTAGVGLVFSNLVDDGAIFYLNGREIQRIRMLPPPYQAIYASTATTTPPGDDAISYDTFGFSGDAWTNVNHGDNVLAVEVHQQNPGSSDVVFGTALSVAPSSGPFAFTEQPTNVTVLDGRPVGLRATTSGDPQPALQWFKNGTAISGATLTTLFFPAAFLLDSGTYWVVASNISMVLTSSPAVLTVQTDSVSPTVLRAVAQPDFTNIVINFSEPIRPGATHLANFLLVKSGQFDAGLTVLSATLSNQTNVFLTTTPRTDGVNYELRLTNIVDLSSASNQVSSAPIPLKYLFRLDFDTPWRFEQSGYDLGTNWLATDFDDSDWEVGSPLFFALPTGPAPVGTVLRLLNVFGLEQVITYYFRTEFNLPGLSTNDLRLRHIIDDGVAVYFNGSPWYSVNVVPPLNYRSIAASSVAPTNIPPLSQPPLSLPNVARPGRNVIAAELHQATVGSPDVAFSFALEVLLDELMPQLGLTIPPTLTNGAGTLPSAGLLTIREALSSNLVVTLQSMIPSAVSVPLTVTLPAGQTNVAFDIAVTEDPTTIGPRRLTVRADALGFVGSAQASWVVDKFPLAASLVLPPSALAGSIAYGRFQISAALPQDLAVRLGSSNPRVVGVQALLIIPAGQTSAIVRLQVPNRGILGTNQMIEIGAQVIGWPRVATFVEVFDKPASLRTVSIPSRDIAYDPVTRKIYASLPGSAPGIGNQIVPIDPENGAIEAGFWAGNEPGKLLVNPSGGKLYASVETNQWLRRIDLASQITELSFSPETNAPLGQFIIHDFELLPGIPTSVAVLRHKTAAGADVAIFDEGLRRANVATVGTAASQGIIEASSDGTSVYAQNFAPEEFRRLAVDAQGTTAIYVATNLAPSSPTRDWRAVEERLFSSDGVVIDPVIPQVITNIPGIPVNSLLTYDSRLRRLFYLSPQGSNWVIRAYETTNLAFIGSVVVSNVLGTPSALIRWGDFGLTFRTDADQLFLIKTWLLLPRPISDVSFSLTMITPPASVGHSIPHLITITNHGPNEVLMVAFTNLLPRGAANLAYGGGSGFGLMGSAGSGTNLHIYGVTPVLPAESAAVSLISYVPSLAGILTNQAWIASSDPQVRLVNKFITLTLSIQEDVDQDGLGDDWETEFFGSTNTTTGPADFDGDNISNMLEFLNGTDPKDPANALRISKVSQVGNSLLIRFHGLTGRRYEIERADEPQGPWSSASGPLTGNRVGLTVTNAWVPGSASAFFRLRQLP